MSMEASDREKQKSSSLQQQLVDLLKSAGHLSSPAVEAAFRAVPRHLFLPDVMVEEVYRDLPIPTKSLNDRVVSSSSQPTIMAIMLEQLDLKPGQRVLEIGAGTGYNAALIAHIVGREGQVVTMDIDEDIVEGARRHLSDAGYPHVRVICGDGFTGYPQDAPYDRIILTVNAGDIAPAWREQLKPGGRLLLPLSIRGPQVSVAFEERGDHLESVSLHVCGFMGLRGALAESFTNLQLRPLPDTLSLTFSRSIAIEAGTVRRWLRRARQDIPTSVEVTYHELLYSLSYWLAVHDERYCSLLARGAGTEQVDGARLFHFPYDASASGSAGLLETDSLALLVPLSEHMEFPSENTAYSLGIRSFGEDGTHRLAQRLKEYIQSWDTAGRPGERRLHIRAYARDTIPQQEMQEPGVSKRWTHFVFNW
jgi:protein-L-isoaspartate(D-aspartate) O-methyltransferase